MKVLPCIELATASVPGRMHLGDRDFVLGRNNQDAYFPVWSPERGKLFPPLRDDVIVAGAFDGCSGNSETQVRSEHGALWGSRVVPRAIMRTYDRWVACETDLTEATPFPFWERVRMDVLAKMRVDADWMGDSLSEVISNYFLFTVVGILITPYGVTPFSIGDGVYYVNGERTRLGPFPNNEPPYMAFGLEDGLYAFPELVRFQVGETIPVKDLKHFLVGVDGVIDLEKVAESNLPGTKEPLGPISQFWENDEYFENPDAARRRLARANRNVKRFDPKTGQPHWFSGLLPDDTTFVSGRVIHATE